MIATAFAYKDTLEEAFFPIAVMVNTIPVVAKAPILVLLLGNGMEPKIAIAALICFFPTLVNMTRGLRDVNPQQLELMHVLSASPREVFLKVRLKNSLPYLFSAMKVGAILAVAGAIVGEFVASSRGLGYLMIQVQSTLDTAAMFMAVILLSALGIGLFMFVQLLERIFVVKDARLDQGPA